MDYQGVSALIVAGTGALATVGGFVATRRGRAEERRQLTAADKALGDRGRLKETQQALDAMSQSVTRLEASEGRLRDRVDELEAEVDAERDRRRRELNEQEARCRTATAFLTDTIDTLRTVVVDEISRAAAGERVAMVRPHPHDPTT